MGLRLVNLFETESTTTSNVMSLWLYSLEGNDTKEEEENEEKEEETKISKILYLRLMEIYSNNHYSIV